MLVVLDSPQHSYLRTLNHSDIGDIGTNLPSGNLT